MIDSAPPDMIFLLPDMRTPIHDIAPPILDFMAPPTPDFMAPPTPDMEISIPDMALPIPDMALPIPDMVLPIPDMALPIPDMALPIPDMAPPLCEFEGQCMPGSEVLEASSTHPSLRYIPAGQFWMGSPAGEINQQDDEDYHQVTITRPFLMMATEVTKAEWSEVVGANPDFNSTPSNFMNCPTCPVDNVNWFAAAAFANELSRLENLDVCYEFDHCQDNVNFGSGRTCAHPDPINLDCTGYRLPTEAEWEYAARARTEGPHYGELIRIAWFSGNAIERPHQVGRKQPNAWNLYDMLGNVSEWTGDWSGDYNLDDLIDPMGPPPMLVQRNRVHRGGAWTSPAQNIRAAHRDQRRVGDRGVFLGFRLVRGLPQN